MKARRPKSIPINIGGAVKNSIVYNIGYLAHVIGKTPAAVRAWERDGLLPRTPFTIGGKSERVYTEEMINAVKVAFEMRGGKLAKGDELFYRDVVSRWELLGIEF